jgi:hypothetical protein
MGIVIQGAKGASKGTKVSNKTGTLGDNMHSKVLTGTPKIPSWMKVGAEAQTEFDTYDQQMNKLSELRDRARRFWLKPLEKAYITFLDGELVNGILISHQLWEHNIQINGRYEPIVCVHEDGECYVCLTTSDKPSLVRYFTIIDHREFKARDGKVYKNQIRLLAAKRGSIKTLTAMAIKRGGLAGCTFEVTRTEKKQSNIGNLWDFEKKRTLQELQKVYGTKDTLIRPLDYAKEAPFYSKEDLIAIGFNPKESELSSIDYAGGGSVIIEDDIPY